MNIVFWLLVIIVLVLVWFCLSFAFKDIEANAAAEVVRIAAEAEAAANQQIAQSLTPELIEKIKYEQWNGVLPKVNSSGGTIVGVDGID